MLTWLEFVLASDCKQNCLFTQGRMPSLAFNISNF